MYVVYKHTSPSGKVYIGITGRENVNLRWCNGLGYSGNRYFIAAIKKYGWNNFNHEILKSGLTFDEACDFEIKFIAEYKANNPKYGYNISSGGYCGNSGTHHSEESKRKISASNLNKVRSEETRKRISDGHKGLPSSMKGKHHTEETKQKISIANTGHKHTEASRNYIRKTGYHLSEEHKQNISNALKGKKKSPEHIEKVRKANTGKIITDEQRKRMSESHKGRKLSEEQKRKISESMKKYKESKSN